MEGHHLVLGTLKDLITGESLPETHDERYRQQIAHRLINELGYAKANITPREQLVIQAGRRRARVPVDFLVAVGNRIAMLIKYGPGSLVTRQRPALAASRLVADYQVPVVVVTNGEDAQILDGDTGAINATGLARIPSKLMLAKMATQDQPKPISPQQAAMEARILYAYEVDDACPCDSTICRINT